MAIVPVKLNRANKLKKNSQSETHQKLVTLLRAYHAKQIIEKFSTVKTGDEVIAAAKSIKIQKQIGNGGGAILIEGGKEGSDSIKKSLINNGWVKEIDKPIDGGNIVVLKKDKEKINIRDFDSSGDAGSYPGYTHQMTVDVLKYANDSQFGDSVSSQEIKFILLSQ